MRPGRPQVERSPCHISLALAFMPSPRGLAFSTRKRNQMQTAIHLSCESGRVAQELRCETLGARGEQKAQAHFELSQKATKATHEQSMLAYWQRARLTKTGH